VVAMADVVASTDGMIKFAHETDAREIIVGTEQGLVERLRVELPEKTFYIVPHTICPNMKKTTAEKVLASLEHMQYEIDVAPEIAERARRAVARMLEVS
jgi:quinolinate synthase